MTNTECIMALRAQGFRRVENCVFTKGRGANKLTVHVNADMFVVQKGTVTEAYPLDDFWYIKSTKQVIRRKDR